MGTDSLYYIMDYSGHYYRTDKSDQLVAVAGTGEQPYMCRKESIILLYGSD